jgi:hypothetical protein
LKKAGALPFIKKRRKQYNLRLQEFRHGNKPAKRRKKKNNKQHLTQAKAGLTEIRQEETTAGKTKAWKAKQQQARNERAP